MSIPTDFGRCWDSETEFGTYDNVVSMKHPTRGWVCIDSCIASEIAFLWRVGIDTLNSCCGHGKMLPNVIVSKDSYDKMEELHYQWYENTFGARIYLLKTKAFINPEIIILFGSPGSGKSTQGRFLEKEIGWKFLSLGEYFRRTNNPRIQEQLKTSKLFSDGEAFEVLQQNILQYKRVILDGFPRNLNQLDLLDCGQFNIRKVFCLDVSREMAMTRMLGRGRDQDNEKVINERLDAYFDTEELMKKNFEERFGKIYSYNGEDSEYDILQKLKADSFEENSNVDLLRKTSYN